MLYIITYNLLFHSYVKRRYRICQYNYADLGIEGYL